MVFLPMDIFRIRIRIRIRFYWPSKFAQTRNLTWQSDSQCAYTKYTTQYNTIQYNTIQYNTIQYKQTNSATVQWTKEFKKVCTRRNGYIHSCAMLRNSSAKKKWRVREVQG